MSMSWISSSASKIVVGAATLLSPEAKEEPVNRLLVDSIRAEARDHSKDQLALRIDPKDVIRGDLRRDYDEICRKATEFSRRHAKDAEWNNFFIDIVEPWNNRLKRFEKATGEKVGLDPIDTDVLRGTSEIVQWFMELLPQFVRTNLIGNR